MQFEKLKIYVLNQLQTELSSNLFYHNVEHTQNVLIASEKLAANENISGDDLILLRSAAILHDVGFLQTYAEHERSGCEISRILLRDYEYSDVQIENICEMIMATRLPQSPKNALCELLCDADLYYIGTNDYEKYAERLFNELKAFDIIKTDAEWHEKQKQFLSNHAYFSNFAKRELEATKKQNLDNLLL